MTSPFITAPRLFDGNRRVTVPGGHRVLLLKDGVPDKLLEAGRRNFFSGDIPGFIGRSRLQYVVIDLRHRALEASLGRMRTHDARLVDVSVGVSVRLRSGVDWIAEWNAGVLENYAPEPDVSLALADVARRLVAERTYAELDGATTDAVRWGSACPRTAGLLEVLRVSTVAFGRDRHMDELQAARDADALAIFQHEARRNEKWRDDQAIIRLARELGLPPAMLHEESKEQALTLMRLRLEALAAERELPLRAIHELLNGSPFALSELQEFAKQDPRVLELLLAGTRGGGRDGLAAPDGQWWSDQADGAGPQARPRPADMSGPTPREATSDRALPPGVRRRASED